MIKNVTMPAGKYVLGDPCYCFPQDKHNLWMKLLESCEFFQEPIGEVSGAKILGFSTAYGDGGYPGSDGFNYPVDAGLIGLVPYDFAVSIGWEFREDLQTIREWSDEIYCSSDAETGELKFGPIVIATGYTDDEESSLDSDEEDEEND